MVELSRRGFLVASAAVGASLIAPWERTVEYSFLRARPRVAIYGCLIELDQVFDLGGLPPDTLLMGNRFHGKKVRDGWDSLQELVFREHMVPGVEIVHVCKDLKVSEIRADARRQCAELAARGRFC